MGSHWSHNVGARVILDANKVTPLGLIRPNGLHEPLSQLVWLVSYGSTTGSGLEIHKQGSTWVLYDGSTRELYNANGRLISLERDGGRQTLLSYDSKGRIQTVTEPFGRSLSFTYDATTGNLSSLTTPAGVIQYQYDANNNLIRVDNADGTFRTYQYEDPNFSYALTGITDERTLRYSTFGYDSIGRAILTTHPNNAGFRSFVYDTASTLVTDGEGDTKTYFYTNDTRFRKVVAITEGGATQTFSYGGGNLRSLGSETDRNGAVTDYTYAGVQRASQTEAVGTPDARRTDYTYDPRFYDKIATITEPSVFAADPTAPCTAGTDCKVTTYTYDDFGNRLSETVSGYDPSGNPVSSTTTRQYTGPLNQLSFVDGPRTDVNDFTTYRYYPNDTSQPVGTRARLKEIEDATGILTRSAIQYSATGKVLSESRPNGLSLTYTYYPGNDRLHTLTETGPNSTRVTRWTYLATGEVAGITSADGTPDATTLTFGYDNARRLIRLTDGLGNYIAYTLDTEGNRTEEKTFDAGNTLKKQLSQTFDIYNRLNTTAQANETTNPDFAPDGTLAKTTDGNGAVTAYSYDALKRLTRVIQDQAGTDPSTANATTAYSYDAQDRLTSVTDPTTGNTAYTYDDLGNQTSQTSPDTGSTAFQYDAAGNLTQKTDAGGQLFIYSYDALNRLTSLNAPGTDDDITYSYDSCQNGTNRLCTVTYGNGTLPNGNQVHYQYTAYGDVTQHQGILYGYDAQGRIQTLDYPSGARLTYSYDIAGQISQVDLTVNTPSGPSTNTLASAISYAPFGPLTGLTYGNGLSLSQTLDTAYRLTAQTTAGVLDRSYPQYDANGNRISQTDTLASASNFSYDPLNRLDTASGPFGTRDYDYDPNGNRTQLIADTVTTPLTYEPNSNRLDTLGATNVLLDAVGNTLNQGNWSYSYTPHNRLKDATETATLKASFAYNGLGQRTTKTDETMGAGRYYLYGTNGELLVEADTNGYILLEYLYLNGQLLAVFSPDHDMDGQSNQQEALAGTLPTVSADSDGDSLTNLTEWFQYGTNSQNADSDGDGVPDNVEIANHTDPNLPSSVAGDGDLNHNGQINLGDLLLLYQYVLGLRTIDADALTHGDMNRDGQLNTPDLLLLQKLLLQSFFDTGAPSTGAMAFNRSQGFWADWLNRFIPSAYAFHSTNNGVLYYVHNDPLGTPQVLTDESGTVVWTASYDPFGKATVNEDPDNNGNSVTLNVHFPGQYYDRETGLHYNYFRYYDPSTGRYITADPAGQFPIPIAKFSELLAELDLKLNHLYAYVASNPLKLIDPFGLAPSNGCNPPDCTPKRKRKCKVKCNTVGGLLCTSTGSNRSNYDAIDPPYPSRFLK